MTSDEPSELRCCGLPRGQVKPAVALLLSTVLMLTWWYFGSRGFLWRHLPTAGLWGHDRATVAALGSFLAAFVLLGLIPALVVTLGLRERLADYGVRWGDARRTLWATALLVPLFVLGGYLSSSNPSLRAYYPLTPTAGASAADFALHAAAYLLFYLGWEFHFRGFLQHALQPTAGDASAVAIQVLASCLLHLGKPAIETYSAILGGILWGVLAIRTKSLFAGLAQHSALGLSLDWFLCRSQFH